jgi:dihydropyrimidinase
MRTLIQNGLVVTADGSFEADVLVVGEKVEALARRVPNLAESALAGLVADETIDATGRYIVPGGVDVHTHLEVPFGQIVAKDTFESGTRAAAHGGTTTVIDFAIQPKGRSLQEGFEAWLAKAAGNAVIDYGFHMIVSEVSEDSLAEMDRLVAAGITTFKLHTAYAGVFLNPDADIFRALRRSAANGGLIMMHAENGPVIDVIAADLVAAGTSDPIGHGLARHPILEGEATGRVIRLAEVAGVPIYIVHVTARQALEEIVEARDRGLPVFAETCPQYLFLSLDDLGGGFEGAKYVCSPPLRPKDHQDDLWRGLRTNHLQLVATDHCPFDFHGQKELGRDDFRKIPNGLPSIEDRVDLLHQGGVVEGRISRERWVEITATAPAKLFGMYPQKGTVAVGSDADLLVYDPHRKRTISAASHHMAVDYSIFEGFVVQGSSDLVMSRGTVLVRDGRWVGPAGHGRFVRRTPADFRRLA